MEAHQSTNNYGKFGERFYLDEERFEKAYQMLWDYLYLRLKQRNFRKFHWQKVGRKRLLTRRVIVRTMIQRIGFPENRKYQRRATLKVIDSLRLPEPVESVEAAA